MGLSPELLRAVEALGFTDPTPIQKEVIPRVLSSDNDIVGLAQTGTGKTAAFGLPVIEQVDTGSKTVQALVLAPTRELCIQITKDLQEFSKYKKDLHVVPVYGGASMETQIRALKRGAQIIVATPGRMIDLIGRKAANISQIRTVVLDEADEMLNMGFREEIDRILESTPDEKRTLLFSATMPKEVARIASSYMHNPVEITVDRKNSGARNVQHVYYQVHASDRYPALKRIADMNPDIYSIVFCRTRRETKDIAEKLIKDGYSADAIHGELSQSQRDHVMKRFRSKSIQMLVATDVAARGIDVDDVSHVINYNLPEDVEVYTHRSGRTGRAGKSGVAVSIIHYREKSRISQIEKMIGKKVERLPVPSGKEICGRQLFKLIDRMEKAEVNEEQIAPFMDEVMQKLDGLSKEEIIKQFVSLEFNRFLEYYKNSPDLNDDSGRKSRRDGTGRSRSEEGSGRGRSRSSSYTRFFMNVGKKDGIIPTRLIGMINENTNDRDISIGAIDIKDSFSFFEVDSSYSSQVLAAFEGSHHKGRSLRVALAEAPTEKRNGNSHYRGKEKRDRMRHKRKRRS